MVVLDSFCRTRRVLFLFLSPMSARSKNVEELSCNCETDQKSTYESHEGHVVVGAYCGAPWRAGEICGLDWLGWLW